MKDPYPKDLKDTPATRRRSVYMFHKRVVQQPLMQGVRRAGCAGQLRSAARTPPSPRRRWRC
jgi:hypothetical protein